MSIILLSNVSFCYEGSYEPVFENLSANLDTDWHLGLTGRNGRGKTTLLRLIAGELELERDDRRQGSGICCSRKLTIGMLGQQALLHEERTVEEYLMSRCPAEGLFDRERFEYEREYDCLFTGLGFKKEDKKRPLSTFSGGERTKAALAGLLLEKPDILLLDEPTNHLDMETVQWLEGYLRNYDRAVVMVSHDRFFLDRTAQIVYELEDRKLTKYPGNYTAYREKKRKDYELQKKAYIRQQEEIARQEELIRRFKNKPAKASFARSRKKMLERMERVEAPREDTAHIFTGEILPAVPGSKWVLEAEHLKIGYEGHPLLELSLRMRKGQKIALLGENGAGKTTFLKTAAGSLPPVDGVCSLGNNITIGYFDQYSSAIESEQTVAEHFSELFPSLNQKEVRTILGSYLFPGKEASRKVSSLSGGEKARLVLAELLQSRPNFLILDEPTNHMDIQARETLESAFQAYQGTILFVSHDRYFIRQVAKSVLIFEGARAMYYPFGYEHYLERLEKEKEGLSPAARIQAEEQALIAGLKAVPRAERHRLREIPTEEAYDQWRLKMAEDAMNEAAGQAEEQMKVWEENRLKRLWEQAEEQPASALEAQPLEDIAPLWEKWHQACMDWYEIWSELHPEPEAPEPEKFADLESKEDAE